MIIFNLQILAPALTIEMERYFDSSLDGYIECILQIY